MTIPRGFQEGAQKVADFVRELMPHRRGGTLTKDETQLAVFLRGNEPLFTSLSNIIQNRVRGRAAVPEPSDPVTCKSMLARDRELQWLLARLEFIYRSPVLQAQERGEPPA